MSGTQNRGLVSTGAPMRIGDVVVDWLSVLLAFIVAAILVSASHQLIPTHPATRLIASVAAILAVAFLHARGAFPRNHVQPLTVGVAWLALSIGSEMIISAFLGQEWDGLLALPIIGCTGRSCSSRGYSPPRSSLAVDNLMTASVRPCAGPRGA